MPSPEILAVLADEVVDAAGSLAILVADLDGAAPDNNAGALDRYCELVGRVAATAEMLNLDGLQALCAQLVINVKALVGGQVLAGVCEALLTWPALVIGYLRAPKDGVYSHELINHFKSAIWPVPLTDDAAADLLQRLERETAADDTNEMATRPQVATPEDVVLVMDPDVNPTLLATFLSEAALQAGAYTSLIEQAIHGGVGTGIMSEARRLIHSIKGAANTVGVRGVATLTHHLEDLLEYLGQHSIVPRGAVAKLLMDAADCLEMMIETLTDGVAPPAQAQSVLQRLLDVAGAIDRGEVIDADGGLAMAMTRSDGPTADDGVSQSPVESSMPSVQPAAKAPVVATDVAAPPASLPGAAVGPAVPAADAKRTVRVEARAIEEMSRLSGEMTVGRAYILEHLHKATILVKELAERHSLLQDRAAELERLMTVQGVAADADRRDRGSSEIFDALELDEYSAVHGGLHGFVETVADVQILGADVQDALTGIGAAVTQQALINTELHERIMYSRMIPVSSIEPRFARTIRQVCETTGKRVGLKLLGGDVMLDDQLINDLVGPIGHMLRNAVDHGIEAMDTRSRAGKPENGTVSLSFAREANNIVIRCEDDGAGLDLMAIWRTAVRRGLVAESQIPDETAIARLILLSGFSTKDRVSEVSGRGVGMDVVHDMVRKLKGTIDIQTVAGQGCRFILRVPLRLGSAHCLLVHAENTLCAVPTDVLDRVVYAGAEKVERLGVEWVFREHRDTLGVVDLTHLLGYGAPRSLGDADDRRPVLVVQGVAGKTAVVVDAIHSGQDLVIKHGGRYLAGIRGLIGASVLGDGRVLPVLDLPALLGSDRVAERTGAVLTPRAVQAPQTSVILVVDDSLSVRQALSQLLEDDGYQVHTARDGVEALEYLNKQRPHAMLVDLEMPRMNGLELTQRLRERAEMRALPVIMVTSRTSEKHRHQAQLAGVDFYLTKPYLESDLLSRLRTLLARAA